VNVTSVRRFETVVTVGGHGRVGAATASGRTLAARSGVRTGRLPLDEADKPAALRDRLRAWPAPLVALDVWRGRTDRGVLSDRLAEGLLQVWDGPILLCGPEAAALTEPVTAVVPVDGTGVTGVVREPLARWANTFGAGPVVVVALTARHAWPDDLIAPTSDAVGALAADLARAGHDPVSVLPRPLGAEPHGTITGTILAVTRGVSGALLVVPTPRWSGPATHWFATSRGLIIAAPVPVLAVPCDPAAR